MVVCNLWCKLFKVGKGPPTPPKEKARFPRSLVVSFNVSIASSVIQENPLSGEVVTIPGLFQAVTPFRPGPYQQSGSDPFPATMSIPDDALGNGKVGAKPDIREACVQVGFIATPDQGALEMVTERCYSRINGATKN